MAALAMALGLLAFWAGLGMAAQSYPSAYDWRYMTISNLLYPDRNPHGYVWGWAGLAICGVCGLYWVRHGVQGCRFATASLTAGYACMALCALVPTPFLGLPKPHEILALTAFIAVCAGVTRLSFAALTQRTPRSGQTGWRRPCALAVSGLPLLPVVIAAAAQTYASHAQLPWVSLAWRARGIAVYWSFAFWEWLACALYTVFVLWLAVGTSPPVLNYRR
jgi:hypothetical protein